jgi:uncharacterized protein (DUF1800 family)
VRLRRSPSAPDASDPEGRWARYEPTAEAPWDLHRVVHLHRRAGFAATRDELLRDMEDGPGASIDRLLSGRARARGVPEDFESIAALLADAASASNDPTRLKAWWVYRMLFGPDPLGERLTLLWHDHFATSNLKVDDLAAMRRQNDTFRRLARAPFAELLNAAVRDPALQAWLDAPANRKGHPNENLARELLELFTLGVGRFSEADVREAARALTGWTVADGAFRAVAARHDEGVKTVLGRAGRWTGDDLVAILLEQPAIADRLARRLCGLFFGEGAIDEEAIAPLAADLRGHDLDVGRAVATILRSRAFFARANLGSRVVEPVASVLGPVRALELLDPPPSTLVLADWAARLGQDLFYPPNVGGWPGGRAWLSTRAIVGRANYAAALVEGRGVGRPGPLDALGLAAHHGRGQGRDAVITFYAELLLGAEPDRGWHSRIASALGPESSWGPGAARRAVALILACPEAQLG